MSKDLNQVQCVYHIVPSPMIGTILYPLNELASLHPEIAAKHAEKYDWRPEIKKRKVDLLNVYWNDVLHFSTLDLKKTLEAVSKLVGPRNKEFKVWKIPISIFKEEKCVYFNPISDEGRPTLAHSFPEETKIFIAKEYKELNEVPEEQIAWWKEALANNQPPLLFARTRHLLYHGPVETKNLENFSVKI